MDFSVHMILTCPSKSCPHQPYIRQCQSTNFTLLLADVCFCFSLIITAPMYIMFGSTVDRFVVYICYIMLVFKQKTLAALNSLISNKFQLQNRHHVPSHNMEQMWSYMSRVGLSVSHSWFSLVCEVVVTARTRCGWVKFRECGELLYGRRFPLKMKGAVYKSYVRSAILCGSEAWWLKEGEMVIL